MAYLSRLRSRRHDAQPEVVVIPGQRTMDGIIRAPSSPWPTVPWTQASAGR